MVIHGLPSAGSRGRSALYFYDGAYLSRIVVGSGLRQQRLFRFPAYADGVTTYTVDRGFVYWTAQEKNWKSALFRATTSGAGVTRLVSNLFFPSTVVVAGSHVYWVDLSAVGPSAIGRANLDGSDVQRRFIVQPHLSRVQIENGDDFADLTSDGRYLYFTLCFRGAIGRVGLDGRGLNNKYVVFRGRMCPQGIAYADGGTLYFTNSDSKNDWIGRVSVDGSDAQPHWLAQSADSVVADTRDVFWTIGNASGGLIGRASTSGRIINPRFIYPTVAGEVIDLGPTN